MLKNTIKTALVGAACFVALPAMSALAGSNGIPVRYDAKAENYIESRLSETRGATIRQASQPYLVKARLNGVREEVECWAVDYDVRADLGRSRGASTYTVLFYNGRAVALSSDLRSRVQRVPTGQMVASR